MTLAKFGPSTPAPGKKERRTIPFTRKTALPGIVPETSVDQAISFLRQHHNLVGWTDAQVLRAILAQVYERVKAEKASAPVSARGDGPKPEAPKPEPPVAQKPTEEPKKPQAPKK